MGKTESPYVLVVASSYVERVMKTEPFTSTVMRIRDKCYEDQGQGRTFGIHSLRTFRVIVDGEKEIERFNPPETFENVKAVVEIISQIEVD